jgi:predicted transcriptional regulator
MNARPKRMRDIAEKAGVSTQEAASVLQAAVKRGEVRKGRQRGTYRLAKS